MNVNRKSRLIITRPPFVLSLKKKQENKRSLIGGNIEPNEKPIEAMIREAKEEAGIILSKHDIALIKEINYTKENTSYQRYYFLLKQPEQYHFTLGEPDKFEALEWVDFNDVSKTFKKADREVLSKLK